MDFRKTITSLSFTRVMDMANSQGKAYNIINWSQKEHKFLFFTYAIEYTLILELKQNAWSLAEQLQDAIDREDYAAAARLRDLINKK